MNQRKKKGAPKSVSCGSQKTHRADAGRDRHPDRVLRRIIQSSGFAEAERYAEKHGLNRVLEAIQKKQVQQPNTGFLPVPVRWIEQKKAEARHRADGFAPIGYHKGRALRRWQELCG
ncbi:MAG: hypothetical protein HYY86_01385 [Candidatus Harrisonbacteria bacterium]|nr:hypothetical protein [Candidatus Harrisonbacteria bacterium]